MLLYEHERTQSIVARLTSEAATIHTLIILLSTLAGAAIAASVGAPFDAICGLVGLIVGGIVGYGFGRGLAKIAVAVLEWMAQMLVVQGQILDTLQKEQDSNR